MKITFKTIQLHNFMSFNDAYITLNSPGYTLVRGENLDVSDNSQSNGSGKSSIFDALIWCLTGETMRGSKEVKKQGTKECFVKLTFLVGSDEYEITRSI